MGINRGEGEGGAPDMKLENHVVLVECVVQDAFQWLRAQANSTTARGGESGLEGKLLSEKT